MILKIEKDRTLTANSISFHLYTYVLNFGLHFGHRF